MYYGQMGQAFLDIITESKGIISVLVTASLSIFALLWGIEVFKRAVSDKYYLDQEADDYLASSDPDEYFSKYGADD